jgi:DNA ligase 1
MTLSKPMLASPANSIESITYPVLASVKLDGIRALVINGKLVSRTFKPIPNHYIRTLVEAALPSGMDGELIVGSTFQSSSSGIMSQEGTPDFVYYIFDWVQGDLKEPFEKRYAKLKQYLEDNHAGSKHFKLLPHVLITGIDGLTKYEEEVVAEGHEGVMVRDLYGPYKCGRATTREGYLLKIKRFEDSEAEIVGFEEQMHNANEAEKDNFGRTKRSTAREGMVPAGILGAFLVRDIKTGVDFSIGTGLDQAQRVDFWKRQASLAGKIVKYRFQPTGVLEAPRFPVFLGFRSKDDL